MTEKFTMNYNGKFNVLPNTHSIPIMPNTWYHTCTRLDTITGKMMTGLCLRNMKILVSTGHVTVVVNGIVARDEVDEFFVGSSSTRPKSLKG